MLEKMLIDILLDYSGADELFIEVGRALAKSDPKKFILLAQGDNGWNVGGILVDQATHDEVAEWYMTKNRVKGIQTLRNATGCGLRECKEAADAEFYHLLNRD